MTKGKLLIGALVSLALSGGIALALTLTDVDTAKYQEPTGLKALTVVIDANNATIENALSGAAQSTAGNLWTNTMPATAPLLKGTFINATAASVTQMSNLSYMVYEMLRGYNTYTAATDYAELYITAVDATQASTDGRWTFRAKVADTMTSLLTLDAAGANVGGNLTVGAGGTLTMGGAVTITNSITLSGASGDIIVSDDGTFVDDVIIGGTLTVSNGVVMPVAAASDLTVGDDITVVGDGIVGGNLVVTGNVTAANLTTTTDTSAGNWTVGGGGNLIVGGTSALTGTVTMAGNASVAGTLSAPWQSTLGNVNVTTNLYVAGTINGTGTVTMAGSASVAGTLSAPWQSTLGNVNVTTNLYVTGTSQLTGTVTHAGATVHVGGLTQTGDQVNGGTLTVTGVVTMAAIPVFGAAVGTANNVTVTITNAPTGTDTVAKWISIKLADGTTNRFAVYQY